jgi:hypothetical protein
VSNEGKIGIAAVAVALVVVIWLASGRGPEGESAAPARPDRGGGVEKASQSDRVRERLARLRAERMAVRPGAARPRSGQAGFPSQLPTPAFGALPGSGAAPRAAVEDEDELDFETLRDMALIDEDPDNRVSAIWLLASMDEEEDEKEVLPVLTQALSDEDPEVRMAAIQALSEFSEETPIESLGVALGDEDAEIRFEALSIVAELSDERAQPLISQALDDPDEDVRSLAEGLADMEDIYEPVPAPAVEPLP